VATKNALQFVTKLSIETLSQSPLYYDSFETPNEYSVEHIAIADWADVVVIAPATANIIGKLAHGIADDALSTFLLATKKPVFFAPAMNCNMYDHLAVQENITILKNRGIQFIDPSAGFLACGYDGKGRMEEPDKIFEIVANSLKSKQLFLGKHALVTAGPTYEPIDPVRFIGNYSSGLMGFELAEELAKQGALVTLIAGPTQLTAKNPLITTIKVQTAQQMYDAVFQNNENCDLIIMAAAVADYTPSLVADQKIKKNEQEWQISVHKTKDILFDLGKSKNNNQCIVGFALETQNELENAKIKLQNKNADFIVLNSMNNNSAGFNKPTNQVTILSKNGVVLESKVKAKSEIAKDIINTVFRSFFSN
jgi:phosphopantothenoylcysteine decarboxylase / phosphopantothenate---cysteine ligase